MSTPLATVTKVILVSLAAAFIGCGSGPRAPTKTTTTHTHKTTVHDTGEASMSDVKETKTEQANGSENTTRTVVTEESSPPPAPEPAPKSAPK
jgi:hypothetical protein